jgi:hypothetical protein
LARGFQGGHAWRHILTAFSVLIAIAIIVACNAKRLNLVHVEEIEQWGFMDERGNVVIPPKYSMVQDFSEGLAVVKVGKNYGYIDRSGKMAIPPRFGCANAFTEGVATIVDHGRVGFIDKTGGLVIDCRYYSARPFSDGLAAVQVLSATHRCPWGFINRRGRIILPPKYEDAYSFKCGLAAVRTRGANCYIDKTGRIAIAPRGWNSVYEFKDGFARVTMKTPTRIVSALIDRFGKPITTQWFHNADDFWERRAWVNVNGRWGCIDTQGRFLITPRFECQPSGFAESMASVEINGWESYIDRTGKVVIPPRYNDAYGFHNGVALVRRDERWMFIDKTGRIVGRPRFDRRFRVFNMAPLQEARAAFGIYRPVLRLGPAPP